MSVSEHPIALRLEQRVGGATKLLATVMGLPLVDGIFPALVIAGVLTTATGIIETGLLIFGGSATVAVILAEMEGTPRQQATSILLIGAVLVPIAAIEAALALTLDSLLNLAIFERFAGLVILAIAAKTASSKVGEYLPSPGLIVAFGLVASISPNGASLQLANDPTVVLQGAAAAGVGVAFATLVALLGPQLRGKVDIDRFRFGSAVALGVLALPILGLLQTDAPIALAVLAVTILLAYNPDAESAGDVAEAGADDDDDDDGASAEDAAPIDEPIVRREDDSEPELNTPTGDDATAPGSAPLAANGGTVANGGTTASGGTTANGGAATSGMTADGVDEAFEHSVIGAEPADLDESGTDDREDGERVDGSETADDPEMTDSPETADDDGSGPATLDDSGPDAEQEESGYGYPGEDEDRAPWL